MSKRLYLCDREAPCKDKCSYPDCKHTADENHAVHKIRRERKWEIDYDSNGEAILIEKETK